MISDVLSSTANYGFIKSIRHFIPHFSIRNYLIDQYQLKQMRKLVNYAFHKSEFYYKYYGDHGIKEKDIPYLKYTDLPTLTKPDIIKNKDKIYTDSCLNYQNVHDFIYYPESNPLFQKNYIAVMSSGSTGTPTSVIYSKKEWNKILYNLYLTSKTPKQKNKSSIRIAAIVLTPKSTARMNTALSVVRSMKSKKYIIKEISARSSLEEIVRMLNEFQPHQILSYSGLFSSLLPFQKNGVLKISPNQISLGGEELTSENQKIIANAFQAQVINGYGSSECMFIGKKMTHEEHFQMFPHCAKFEILNSNNQHVKSGEVGKVVVTNFLNYTQPFIRYELGDNALFEINRKGEPSIKKITSRVFKHIHFQNNTGNKVSFHPLVLYDTLIYLPEIEKSQITLKDNMICARIVTTNDGVTTAVEKFKQLLVDRNLDKSVKLKIEKVDFIPPEVNGKTPPIKYELQNI